MDKNVPTKETFENSIPKSQLFTLSASGWDANTKIQTIAVDGVLADEDNQLITITPKSVSIIDYANAGVYASGQAADSLTFTCNTIPTVDLQIYVTIETVKKTYNPYLTFSSPNSFTLKTNNATKNWNGTLEYSTNTKDWSVWDGTTTLNSSSDNKLYLRGTGNTKICNGSSTAKWVLTGSNISCNGNIETLLDYQTVLNGEHPAMAANCYANMFNGCTSLVTAPTLPATTLTDSCYSNMFKDCTALTTAPILPATTLIGYCYYCMFQNCTSLVIAPALPATILAPRCYDNMFNRCTSLTEAPALPATTLADQCYYGMFSVCKSLVTIPALPATTLTPYCYGNMFSGCTKIKLSTTKTGTYTQEYRIPTSGTGTTATDALNGMFGSTGGTFTGIPTINTTYYLDSSNTIV